MMSGFSDFHLKCVYFMSAMDIFSIGLAIPLLSPHLKSLGASHLVIGLSTSLYGAAQLFSSPLVGSWSDQHGRMSVLTYTLIACSLLYFMLGHTTSLMLILTCRFLIGCFKHTQSLCKSIIADEIPPFEQASVYGKLAAISGVGFVVGPVIGGHISDHKHGFSYITVIILICSCVNLVVAQNLPSSRTSRSGTRQSSPGLKRELLKMITHLKRINWVLVFSLSFYFSNSYLMLQEKFGMTSKSVGYIISYQSLIGSVTSLLSNQIQHIYEWKYPPQKASAVQVVHCFAATAVGLIGINFATSTAALLMWLIPLASGAALLRTLLTELLVQKASAQERGSLLGATQSFSAMSRLSTPLIAGVVTDWFSNSAVLFLSQVGTVVGALAAYYLLQGEYLEHYVH